MQPSQPNQAELPEFRAADAKSKAANFRAVETKHETWTTSFQSGRETETRLMRLDVGMRGLRCHFRKMKF
jgi:hypothetical protein